MKPCSVCGSQKTYSEYYFKNKSIGKLHSQCKSCYAAKRRESITEHYRKYGDAYRERARKRKAELKNNRQQLLYEYLSDKACEHCGIDDMRVLEFDHIDEKTKIFGIARAINEGYSWSQIQKEIKKCRILCANCHRIRTAEQYNWRRMARWPSS